MCDRENLLSPTLSFDPVKDFVPISMIGSSPYVLAVYPELVRIHNSIRRQPVPTLALWTLASRQTVIWWPSTLIPGAGGKGPGYLQALAGVEYLQQEAPMGSPERKGGRVVSARAIK